MFLQTKNKIVICIDPDIDKNGIAIFDMRKIENNFYSTKLLLRDLVDTFDVIQSYFSDFDMNFGHENYVGCEILVVIETGEKNNAYFNAKEAVLSYLKKSKVNVLPTLKNGLIKTKHGMIELSDSMFNAVLGICGKVGGMSGVNFGVSRLLVQFCQKYDFQYKEFTPKLAKLTSEQILKRTGLTVKDSELKDAIRIFLTLLDLGKL